MKRTGNTILITGGGSGIGQALAHRFDDRGDTVIVAGRRREALERAIEGRERMHALELDVEDPRGVAAFAERALAEHPAINVLINNAGVMKIEDITARRDLADAEATVVTNLLGPIRLIDAFVDHLSAQSDAVIVNVTSGLAFVPMTGAATYSATKAAMHSYTVSLRHRLQGKVEVLELAPPGVQTDLTPGQSHRPGYMSLADFTDEAMGLFSQEPTPSEMPVQRARMLRTAEIDGRFDQTLIQLNDAADKARREG